MNLTPDSPPPRKTRPPRFKTLRRIASDAGGAIVDAKLAQMSPYYIITPEMKQAIHTDFEDALAAAFTFQEQPNRGEALRSTMVKALETFDEAFTARCAHNDSMAQAQADGQPAKKIGALFTLGHVRHELKIAMGDAVNRCHRTTSVEAVDATPTTRVNLRCHPDEPNLPMQERPGFDIFWRTLPTQHCFDEVMAGVDSLEALRVPLHAAVKRAAAPTMLPVRNLPAWIRDKSADTLEQQLNQIRDLSPPDRALLMEHYRASVPCMVQRAEKLVQLVSPSASSGIV